MWNYKELVKTTFGGVPILFSVVQNLIEMKFNGTLISFRFCTKIESNEESLAMTISSGNLYKIG